MYRIQLPGIKLYLCGIHYNYLIAGVANPFEGQGNNALQLKMLLIGIMRTRLPIDSIINDAGKFLPCGYFSSMHTSLILTGFINYRRGGILTVPGRFSQLDSSIL
jgi:hypothetical protein